MPLSADLDGDVLATLSSCDPRPEGDSRRTLQVAIHDLAHDGAPKSFQWDPQGLEICGACGIAIAGRYLAWFARGPGPVVIVYDTIGEREVLRTDLRPKTEGAPAPGATANFDLQDDGTVITAVEDDRGPFAGRYLVWASPQQLTPQLLPLRSEVPSGGVAISDGLVALQAPNRGPYQVVDLAGTVRNAFDHVDLAGMGSGMDFDGRQVAWARGDGVHGYVIRVEPYPVVASVDLADGAVSVEANAGGAAVPIWCPTPKGRCTGTVSLQRRSGKKRTTLGTGRFKLVRSQSRDVNVPLSNSARRLLAKRKALRVYAITRASNGKSSTHSAELVKLTLRR